MRRFAPFPILGLAAIVVAVSAGCLHVYKEPGESVAWSIEPPPTVWVDPDAAAGVAFIAAIVALGIWGGRGGHGCR